MNVMLVEDDCTMRALLKTLLEIEGFDVQLNNCVESEEIIEDVCARNPDVLLLDVNLRKANGIDLLKRIRMDERCNNLYVIMTSGMDLKKDCLNLGADDFLQKPYMPDELIDMLRKND